MQLEQYWRRVQVGETRQMQRGFTLASLGGSMARQLAVTAHERRANVHCASTEASKHALLARNRHILVDSDNGRLRFRGLVNVESLPMTARGTRGLPWKAAKVVRVDLHGVDVRNAVQFVDSLLTYCRDTSSFTYEVHLIVGRGSHSIGGVPRLKPALKSFLQSRHVVVQSSSEGEIHFFV